MLSKKGMVVSVLDQEGNLIPLNKNKFSIPFYFKYQIKIRNTNNRFAAAKLYLDGVSISEERFVVPPGTSVILHSFQEDGGGKFQFVESINPEVKKNKRDREISDKENVSIRFWLEKEDEFGYFDKGQIDRINEYQYLFSNGELKPEKTMKIREDISGYSGVSGYSGYSGLTISDSTHHFEILHEQIEELEKEEHRISFSINPYTIDGEFRIPKKKKCSICDIVNSRWARFCMSCGTSLVSGGYEDE